MNWCWGIPNLRATCCGEVDCDLFLQVTFLHLTCVVPRLFGLYTAVSTGSRYYFTFICHDRNLLSIIRSFISGECSVISVFLLSVLVLDFIIKILAHQRQYCDCFIYILIPSLVSAGPADLPFFDLLSIFGKLRAGFGAMGLRPAAPGREESVKEFVTRNLGQEVFERLIEPFCSGVYAGDPSKLSMKAAFGKVWKLEEIGGSIIGGTFKMIQDKKNNPPPPRDERLPKPKGQTVGSFKKGLITLPNAIAAQLGDKVKVNWKLTTIKKTDVGYTLTYETPEGTKTVNARSLVLTVPAYVAKEILRPLSEGAAEALSQFYYPPVCAATISYPLSALREDRLTDGKLFGFGQLHPRTQGVQTLGTIYSSSLFPNRAPEDRVLLLNYIGGAQFTQITEKSDEEIVKTVDKDLRTMLLKPDAPAPQMHGVRTWPTAIPQFTIGHLDHLESAKGALKNANCEGLFLGGNYVVGVALGRCVEGAYESAQAIAQYVSQIPAKTGSS
ncbi:hypothetical protein M758_6G008000 [Ceratodon purpureus]|nr:hypothetical protein M758_6G008000 [Ceratodon purpureus]